MSKPDPVALERFRYQQGQRLRSADRRDQVAIEGQLRWWHNRAMHNAFGVAEGMAVNRQIDHVVVEPGIAYDNRGRELILQKPRTVALPILSETDDLTTWLLVARYKETSEFTKRSEFSGGCFCHGSFFLESPEFLWKLKGEWMPQDGVPLASFDFGGVTKRRRNPRFVKPVEHGQARHRVVTGETLIGNTDWEPWIEAERELGFQVKIDTRQSGFTQTPCYFAWLQRITPSPPARLSVVVPFSHILNESLGGFTFRVWLPSLFMPGNTNDTVRRMNQDRNPLEAKLRFYVAWLAIEEGLGLALRHHEEDEDKGESL